MPTKVATRTYFNDAQWVEPTFDRQVLRYASTELSMCWTKSDQSQARHQHRGKCKRKRQRSSSSTVFEDASDSY